MCRPPSQFLPDGIDTKKNSQHQTTKSSSSFLSKIWPLHPAFLLLLLPFLPTSFYLNRGYTVWFHLMSFSYFLTRHALLRKVLILQGAGICLGWYAAILSDGVIKGEWCHTLYRNMPEGMMAHMVVEQLPEGASYSYIMLNTYSSWAMKALSHVLDTIGHPGLAYLFYKLHLRHGGTLNDVLSWKVILVAWHISRVWSMVHSYHNFGEVKWWYFGHDVYVLNDLNSYLIAYVAEGACFVVAVLCRIYWDRFGSEDSSLSKMPLSVSLSSDGKMKGMGGAPALVHSDSAVSTTSMLG